MPNQSSEHDVISSGVSVVIVSLRAREEVYKACESALAQTHRPMEVIVFVDQADEERATSIQMRCPGARVLRVDASASYIAYRNLGFRESQGEIIVWIDDDAYFTNSDTLQQVVDQFVENKKLGALSLRYLEPGPEVQAPSSQPVRETGTEGAGFVGCAAAFRRNAVEQADGLRELYVAYGEERDLALRLWTAGWKIQFVQTPPIVHLVSQNRNKFIHNSFAVRNTILFDYLNVPFPDVIVKLASDSIKLFLYKLTLSTVKDRLKYVLMGYSACFVYHGLRQPVERRTYRHWRSLPTVGAEIWPSDRIPDVASGCSQTMGVSEAAS